MIDRTTTSERGAAAVEMALVTVLLFIMAAGIADLGRALFTYIGVQDAAQEGVLFGSYEPGNTAEIEQRAIDATDYPSLQPSDIVVVCDSAPDPDVISVTVNHTVDLITPVVGQFLGGSLDLSKTFTGTVFEECP